MSGRRKLFPDAKELVTTLPADKLEALRSIAAAKGLAVTDFVRSVLFEFLDKQQTNK